MDPRMQALADGLPDLAAGGGGGVPPPAPVAAPPAPPSLSDLYMKARMAGMDDTNAALAVAQHLRGQADFRSGMRDAGNVAAGRPTDLAYRQQLMSEADRPMQELAARRQAGPLAAEEVGRQADIAGKDIALQQQRGLLDPAHPTNIATRAILAKIGINVPPNTIAPALPKELWEQVKPLAEQASKAQEIAALAPGRAAEAKAKLAEAGQTTALTGPKVAQTTGEAARAEAEAAHTRMLTSGQVAPGYSRGNIPINEAEATKINDQYQDYIGSKHAIDEILKITGNKNFILDKKTRAQLQPRLATAIGTLRGSIGIRQLAGPELQFAEQVIADPTKLTLSNVTGYAQNRTRFQTLKSLLGEKWDATVKAKDLRQDGASSAVAGGGNDDAAALQWAKANPNDPRAKRVLQLASPQVANR